MMSSHSGVVSAPVDLLVSAQDVRFPPLSVVNSATDPVMVDVRPLGLPWRQGWRLVIPLDGRSASRFRRVRPTAAVLFVVSLGLLGLWLRSAYLLLPGGTGFPAGGLTLMAVLSGLTGLAFTQLAPPQYPVAWKEDRVVLRKVAPRVAQLCVEMNEPGTVRILEPIGQRRPGR